MKELIIKKLFFLIVVLLSTSILNAESFKEGKNYTCKVIKFLGSDGEYIFRNENNTERMDYMGNLSFKYTSGLININGVITTGVDSNIIYFDHKFIYRDSSKTLDAYLDFKYKKPLYFSNETTEVHVIYPDYHSVFKCVIE